MLLFPHDDSINEIIGPNIPEETVQKVYQKAIDNKYFFGISKIMELTHIKPSEDMVHRAYSCYTLTEIAALREITGIAPSKEVAEFTLQMV